MKRSTWQNFQKWILAIHEYANAVQSLFNRSKKVLSTNHPEIGTMASKNYKSSTVCYDFSEEIEEMKDYLLSMFSFCISTSTDYTCNLRCFAVLLHNEPIPVEDSKIYSIVKNWDKREALQSGVQEYLGKIPEIKLIVENPHSYVAFFKQSYYKHNVQNVRLLCWGEIKKTHGDFYFDLPTPQSTRFITLVGITCHRTLFMRYNVQRASNIDVLKFSPFGFLVPCL